MPDVHARLLAAVTARQQRAQAASPAPWHLNPEHDEVWAVDDELVADAHALSSNQQRATARHIAAEDPATALRHVERDLKVLARHSRVIGHPERRCSWCLDAVWPCVEARDLAAAYQIDIEEQP